MDVLEFVDLKKNINVEELYSKIIHANNVDVLKLLPENSIDLIVTSPPYDDLRDYEQQIIWNFEKFKVIVDELYRIMKDGGTIVWVVSDKTKEGNKSLTSFKQAIYFQDIGFNIYDVIIYEKAGSGPPHPKRYFNTFEYMFIITKGKPKTVNLLTDKKNKWAGVETYSEITRREKDGTLTNKGKKTVGEYGIRTNIWRYINGKNFSTKDKIAYKHPAIFPEKLAEDHILSWSNEGDVVLDIFGGSGTTVKQAELLNRKWIYIDKVREYCEITIKRMEDLKNGN
ncbi:DNA-methyltransferase [Aliarcobacter cryaerophilus]|uniref:DNA-methyltransferase n=1 Tax=Aliarcobacter cryaerophilus TaxID=28198 RepID=UPI001654A47D|nr:site-specific DNA-methyltransferase [Aliarcobacter cryaerophilus]QNM93100.1 site-specific DNA-methyltransferase [Aliarcobacter cryaerophilus]